MTYASNNGARKLKKNTNVIMGYVMVANNK